MSHGGLAWPVGDITELPEAAPVQKEYVYVAGTMIIYEHARENPQMKVGGDLWPTPHRLFGISVH